MGISRSTTHLRVAFKDRSSRSIFPVDTVWRYFLLTYLFRKGEGLGLNVITQRHFKDRDNVLRYAPSDLASVWPPQCPQK